jgi:hypothetical protein
MKKGALFGFDARISMLIYAVLTLIAGAVLFSVIKDSKTTALYNELKEIAKANEAYLLDYGTVLEKLSETTELEQSTRKITDLVTVGDKLTGSPYLNYDILGNALKHPRLEDVNIYTLSADLNWSEIDANSYCTELKTCNIWVSIKGFTSLEEMSNLDHKFDDGVANAGDIRYSSIDNSVFLKSIRLADSKKDFVESGVWVTGSWSSCNANSGWCGNGTKTRSVTCSASTCTGAKPSSSKGCSIVCGTWDIRQKTEGRFNSACDSGYEHRRYCFPLSCDPAGAACGPSPGITQDTGWSCNVPSISC